MNKYDSLSKKECLGEMAKRGYETSGNVYQTMTAKMLRIQLQEDDNFRLTAKGRI